MHDVFISYSSGDRTIADAMCHALEEGNEKGRVRCWYAPRNINPGDSWEGAIVKAIKSSRILILIFSEFSNVSVQVHKEITQAMNAGCIVIPYRIDETKMCEKLDYNLAGAHWLDAISNPNEFDSLLNTILDYLKMDEIKDINITTPKKEHYYVGECLNLDGITAEVEYSDGSKEDVTSRINFDVINFKTPGIIDVNVRYCNFHKSFKVTVTTKENASEAPYKEREKHQKNLLIVWILTVYTLFFPAGFVATILLFFEKKLPVLKKYAKTISVTGAVLGIILLILCENHSLFPYFNIWVLLRKLLL